MEKNFHLVSLMWKSRMSCKMQYNLRAHDPHDLNRFLGVEKVDAMQAQLIDHLGNAP